jgi:ATP-dependent DNA helicase PIF1
MINSDNISLNDQQLQVIEHVKNGRNVFVTGSAGTGKSLVIDHIKKTAHKMKKHICVTAMTGMAAANVNGSTLHSWAAIGLGKAEPRKHAFYVKKSENSRDRYLNTDILIVDEISLADYEYIHKVNAVAKLVRGNISKPFGGIQIIFSGDFFQLGPIQKNRETKFLFEDYIWPRVIDECVHLTHIYRQRNQEFIDILQQIRVGKVTDNIIKKIDSTKHCKFINANGIKPTTLFCRNLDVDAINKSHLKRVEGESFYNNSIDYYLDDSYKRLYEKSFTIQQELELKVGAQVMLLININVEGGLVNGSRGVVTKFVRDRSSSDVEDCDPDEYTGPVMGIGVKFSNGREEVIVSFKQEFRDDGDNMDVPPKAFRIQYPLRLAYAITIHKSQGLSIDCLEIDLKGCFTHGQAYVALSRATSFENLRVKNFTKKCIITSEVVKNFYNNMGSSKRSRGELEAIFEASKKARAEVPPMDRNICYICVEPDAIPNMVATPCGHGGICEKCCKGLKDCPKCRGNVERFMKIYLT